LVTNWKNSGCCDWLKTTLCGSMVFINSNLLKSRWLALRIIAKSQRDIYGKTQNALCAKIEM
jgi:hypothetical protein